MYVAMYHKFYTRMRKHRSGFYTWVGKFNIKGSILAPHNNVPYRYNWNCHVVCLDRLPARAPVAGREEPAWSGGQRCDRPAG